MPRGNVMQHFLKGENIGLMICRQQKTNGFYHCLIHNNIVESSFVSNKTSEIGYSFPLYLYPATDKLFTDEKRKPNLNASIVEKIASKLGLQYIEEKENRNDTFAPIDLLDYIYAILHSPSYRKRYKEFLKIDFPRIPYPEDCEQFERLAGLGEKLRKLHLMEGIAGQARNDEKPLANFPIAGTNKIEKPEYDENKVFINKNQYFDNVPLSAWEFYIGGYQPAQKWLKDRKGRTLDYNEIQHYQRIIAVLCETERIMGEIDINLQKLK
jgi:predicted helicase